MALFRDSSMKGSSYGRPQLSIGEPYLRASLDLLVRGGKRLQERKIVKADMFENDITYLLDNEMHKIQIAQKSDIVWWDIRVNISYDPQDPLKRSEIDIKFRWTQYPIDNDRYLAVEAKRLFGKGDSLAGKYVEEGVLDFVIAKYGRQHNYGIMLGYVLAGPLDRAIEAITDAMATRKTKIAEYKTFSPDSSICTHEQTHHSTHIQQKTSVMITLIHLFLDFSLAEEKLESPEKTGPLSGTKQEHQKETRNS
jgi:hypothetical protein